MIDSSERDRVIDTAATNRAPCFQPRTVRIPTIRPRDDTAVYQSDLARRSFEFYNQNGEGGEGRGGEREMIEREGAMGNATPSGAATIDARSPDPR